MTKINWLLVTALLALAALPARADSTQSYVGTLASPNDDYEVLLTLTATSNVTIQTYGFGGGTNAQGTLIAPGGTDPFIGFFANLGLSPTFIDGTSLDLTNYTPGCPAANTVSNFGDTTCGDVLLSFTDLAAGTYTIVLSDGQFIPLAALGASTTFDNSFFDFTGGVFCNLQDVDTGTACPNTSGAFAFDVTESGPSTPAPEPATLFLLGSGLAATLGFRKRRA
ncbi:MAG: DVUA0089 family protein [Candidatus Acidiferrales bacterium]